MRTLIFVGVCLVGFAAGLWLARVVTWIPTGLVAVPLFVSLFCVASASSLMVEMIQERFAQWQAGPAPIGVISDIEDWAGDCWSDLAELRSVPPRGS
jgi:hypothetical protein